MPMMLAARKDKVWPRTAPRVPYPRRTSSGAAVLLSIAWQVIVRLFSCIFSWPVKVAWDAVNSDVEKRVMEAMAIRGADSGLWKIVDAMKFARSSERRDMAIPIVILKVSPAVIMSFMSSCLFSVLDWAMYLIMAELTPQSWNKLIIMYGIRAMEYSPYSSGSISLVRITVPAAIIMVETVFPMNSWKLPVAETLPICNALSMLFWFLSVFWFVGGFLDLVTFKYFLFFFVICGCYGGVCG